MGRLCLKCHPFSLPSVINDQAVGIVPPSITYSLPLIDNAQSDTRNATSSATSSGRPGRPMGIPPSDFINS